MDDSLIAQLALSTSRSGLILRLIDIQNKSRQVYNCMTHGRSWVYDHTSH